MNHCYRSLLITSTIPCLLRLLNYTYVQVSWKQTSQCMTCQQQSITATISHSDNHKHICNKRFNKSNTKKGHTFPSQTTFTHNTSHTHQFQAQHKLRP